MRIEHIIRAIAGVVILLLLAWMLSACKTTTCLPVTEYRDSVVVRLQHDTIQTYEKDSIYIHAKGDTIYRERWSIRYRDKVVERHDTIYQTEQDEIVRVEKVVPQYYKGVSVAFWILIALLALAITARILIKIYLKK